MWRLGGKKVIIQEVVNSYLIKQTNLNLMENIMSKVKLTITESRCRCGYVKGGDIFIIDDLCPPICHELWNSIYPSVYALKNGAVLDYGTGRAKCFDAMCPDECRVHVHGEIVEE